MKVIKVGFTGSRPKDLGGYSWSSPINKKILKKIEQILLLCCEEYDLVIVITGGALGFDQMVGVTAQLLKDKGYRIQTIVAVPFEDQPKCWKGYDLEETLDRYYYILENAGEVVYVDTIAKYTLGVLPPKIYHAGKYIKRNEYIVDMSDMIIACQGNNSKGTQRTIDYARQTGKPVTRIEF